MVLAACEHLTARRPPTSPSLLLPTPTCTSLLKPSVLTPLIESKTLSIRLENTLVVVGGVASCRRARLSETMSSPSPYSLPRQTTYFPSAGHPQRYRQVDYHDGKGVQVVESRRRAPVTSKSISAPRVDARSQTHPKKQAPAYSRTYQTSSQAPQRRSTSASSLSAQIGHVTPRSLPRKSRGQVVIVQGGVSVAVDFGKKDVTVGLATPLPTPKIGRLPTPELEDLDERPFCECCVDVRVVKYCAACGCQMDSWKS